MHNKIHEIFPKCFNRIRSQRGKEAISKIISHPTFEEMCENLFKNEAEMIFFKKWKDGTNEYICSIYKNKRTNTLGLYYFNWCKCGVCTHPIYECKNYNDLQNQYNNFYNSVCWYYITENFMKKISRLMIKEYIYDEIINCLKKNNITE